MENLFRVSWECVTMKVNISFFRNFLNSNTTNIAMDIFIIPTEDIHKKYLVVKKY